jgi:uncharacterized membrane protein
MVVFLYFYHLVFLLAAAFWIYFRKWSYAYIPLLVLILFTATVYPLIPHLSHVKVRNEWLQAGTPSAGGAFAMHWLNAIGVIGLLVWLHFLQRRMSDLGRSLRPAYYWIASILAIFIITSEADHIQVNLLFFPQIPNKDEIIRHSRDIVYPIIWVVCSFVLIFIGLRKQLRPLRIIALALFFISIVKLIVLGISGASEAGKIIAFISSGAVLLIVAFMYQRIKKLFSDDSKTTDDTPLPE